MKRRTAGLFIIVAILAIIAVVRHTGISANDETLAAAALPRPAPLKTGTPQQRDFMETRCWFGKVESRDKARIIALESGMIVSVDAGDGMPVTRGAPLFTIKGPLIDSRLAVLGDRSASLRKRIALAQGMVGIKQAAVSQKLAKHEELAAAKDLLARLKAGLQSAGQERLRLQEAIRVRATLAGVFTNRRVSVGQEVLKGDNLAEIVSLAHIHIAATLFPREDVELQGKEVIINLANGSSIPGTITTVLPERTAEGAVIVWIKGDDPGRLPGPGARVSGMVVLSTHRQALSVPQSAVVRDDKERAYLFLQDSSGYRRQPVTTGIIAGGMVEITAGLRQGDKVVVQGAYELLHRNFNKIYKARD